MSSALFRLRQVVAIVATFANGMFLLSGCGSNPTARSATLAVSTDSAVIPLGLTGNVRAIETSPDGGTRDVTGDVSLDGYSGDS